jgi:hypothetical protein
VTCPGTVILNQHVLSSVEWDSGSRKISRHLIDSVDKIVVQEALSIRERVWVRGNEEGWGSAMAAVNDQHAPST